MADEKRSVLDVHEHRRQTSNDEVREKTRFCKRSIAGGLIAIPMYTSVHSTSLQLWFELRLMAYLQTTYYS